MAQVLRVKEVFTGHFECRHCELDVVAEVRASGWGGEKPLVMMETRTMEEEAVEDASGVASRTLQFVKCPRCGKYDPGGDSYRTQVLLGSIVVGVIVFVLTWLFVKMQVDYDKDRTMVLYIAAGFGVFFSGALYWKWSRPWRGAEKRTRIHYRPE